MNRGDLAEENFKAGMNCSQSVLAAFADLAEVKSEALLAAARGFGGGMGRLRETCGAVTGMVMAAGLLLPGLTKDELYRIVQRLVRCFSDKNGSHVCRELLSGRGVEADTSFKADKRTAEYYKKRPCALFCRDAAEILANELGTLRPDITGQR